MYMRLLHIHQSMKLYEEQAGVNSQEVQRDSMAIL